MSDLTGALDELLRGDGVSTSKKSFSLEDIDEFLKEAYRIVSFLCVLSFHLISVALFRDPLERSVLTPPPSQELAHHRPAHRAQGRPPGLPLNRPAAQGGLLAPAQQPHPAVLRRGEAPDGPPARGHRRQREADAA